MRPVAILILATAVLAGSAPRSGAGEVDACTRGRGQPEAVIRACSAAIRLDPADAEAYANRGNAYAEMATGLTASALPSWALTESAMRASRQAAADHRKALELDQGRR
jgi:hypothetical protein